MRSGVPIKKAGEKSCTTQFSFKKKDGSEMTIPIRFGLHAISKKVIIFIFRIFGPKSSTQFRLALSGHKDIVSAFSMCSVKGLAKFKLSRVYFYLLFFSLRHLLNEDTLYRYVLTKFCHQRVHDWALLRRI